MRIMIIAALAALSLGVGAALGTVLGTMFNYSSDSNPVTINSSTKG
jgi:hypothetical protein